MQLYSTAGAQLFNLCVCAYNRVPADPNKLDIFYCT